MIYSTLLPGKVNHAMKKVNLRGGKLLTLMLLLLAFAPKVKANPVDMGRAREVGAKFVNANTAMRVTPNTGLQLVYTYRTSHNDAAFHVFNTPKGFVIVSADDCATPILGYSEEGHFDVNNVPIQLQEYLDGFVEQIQYGIDNHLAADETIAHQWELVQATGRITEQRATTVVAPLLTDSWGQSCYYNDLCPEDPDGPCGHVVTGCVATSFAQILHYWGYPIVGTGSYTYTPSGYPTQTANFGATTYQWANMPNSLSSSSSSAQVNAVATLMWHCGVAVNMSYGPGASSASSAIIPYALLNYFGYSDDLSLVYREDYSDEEWLNMVKSSLDLGRPVHVRGSDENGAGGHAFVCDGYDANNQLHFNWGWYGSSNGYFALGALNPGGYAFNIGNAAIINIHPSCPSGTTYQVTATASPSYGGTVNGSDSYDCGGGCTLTAVPVEGYMFCSWTENGAIVSTEPTYSFTVMGDRNIEANFVEVIGDQCSLVFTLNDSYGDGWTGNALTVSYSTGCSSYEEITLEGGSSASKTRNVVDGSHIVLGWIEGNWLDECSFTVSYENGDVIYSGSNLNSSFTYEFDVNCDGYTPTYYDITALVNSEQGGMVSGAGSYAYGEVCTLTARANSGYDFMKWTKNGVTVSTESTYSFVVTENATYVASFFRNGTHTLTVNDGTTTNSYVPVYGFYADAYLKCEYIVPAIGLAEMEDADISAMTYYLSNPASASWDPAFFQVFMKEVSSTSIDDFQDMEGATLVYEGSLDGTQTEMNILFSNPYHYNGGNLLVGIYNVEQGSYKSCSFYGETVDGASVQGYSYSGLDTISPTQRNFLPKTTFTYAPAFNGDVDFETGDFSQINFDNTVSNYPWIIWETNPNSGNYCMANGNYNIQSSDSYIDVTLNFRRDGYISFYSRISSESNYDYGYFYIDGNQQLAESGNGNWNNHIFDVTAGIHTFRWSYAKDGSVNNNEDRYYIDDIYIEGVTESQVNLVVTPNPINLGYCPNGAWMRPMEVNIFNGGSGTTVNNVSVTDDYFQMSLENAVVPFVLRHNTGFDLNLGTAGTASGEVDANLVIEYGDDEIAQFDVIATTYNPVSPDVWELAQLVTSFPYTATLNSSNHPLYDNYRLPPAGIADGADAVYKLVFNEDTYLNASVTDGNDGKIALYKEGFNGVGGPDLYNNYTEPEKAIEDWLHYDNGEWYESWYLNWGDCYWGIKIPAEQLSAYIDCQLTKVAMYDTPSNTSTITVNIYKGGSTPAEGMLVHTQDFEPYSDYSFHEVILTEGIDIDPTQDLWIIMHAFYNGSYPAACCTGVDDPNGRWFYYDSNWIEFTEVTDAAWMIRGFVTNAGGRTMAIENREDDAFDVTIGEGTSTTGYLPMYYLYNYSLSTQLYLANELAEAGANTSFISKLSWYSESTYGYNIQNVSIWMANVTESTASSVSPLGGDMTLVYQGNLQEVVGWNEFEFNQGSFAWDGISNVLVMVQMNNGSWSSSIQWQCHNADFNAGSYVYQDNTPYSAETTTYTMTPTVMRANTRFTFSNEFEGEINNMTVTPGTYYLVASSTSDEWTVEINTDEVPCPDPAYNPSPADYAEVNPNRTIELSWQFGPRTTEYKLMFGTTENCEQTLVDWTRTLGHHFTLPALSDEMTYYWKIVERNDGCEEGVESPVWSFTTRLNTPRNLYAEEEFIMEGSSAVLYWTAPARALHYYNVYQDGVLISSTTDTYYVVDSLRYNMSGYAFYVTGVFDAGESDPSNYAYVYVSGYGFVDGHVYEQDGTTGIADAMVSFSGYDEYGYFNTFNFITDANGYYEGSLKAGSYVATASFGGYQNNSYDGSIGIIFNNLTSGIDINLDELFNPVNEVVAEYYPNAEDPESPSVSVHWGFMSNSTNSTFDFEDSSMQGWTSIDADGDGYTWMLATEAMGTGYGYNGSNDCVISMSYNNNVGALYPDNYFVSPLIALGGSISFWACAQDNAWAAEHFGVAVSTTSNTDPNAFTMLEEWTMSAKSFNNSQDSGIAGKYHSRGGNNRDQGTWYQYTVDLSAYSGMGYVAIRHFNCSDWFYLDVDDIAIGEPAKSTSTRAFSHYRVYRTNAYNNGPYTEDNTVLLADNVTDTVSIDVTWQAAEAGVYKWGVSCVYEGNRESEISWGELNLLQLMPNRSSRQPQTIINVTQDALVYDFDDSSMQGWTTIDGGSPAGYGWQIASNRLGTGCGHNASSDCVLSQSYDNNYGVVYPDNYLISPQVPLGGYISFWACAQDAAYASEHFGVAVSTTNNIDVSAFTTIQEWTMTAKGVGAPTEVTRSGNRDQGNWYQYTVDLSAYSGMGYVAIRHFNCSDLFYLDIDDIEIAVSIIQGERESAITWSNFLDKDMYLNNGEVNLAVTLNSGDSPAGTMVSFTNVNPAEQQLYPIANIVLDGSGYYAWGNFRKGDYQVTVTKEGYATVLDNVSIWDATALSYVLEETTQMPTNLYVSSTGWAKWNGLGNDLNMIIEPNSSAFSEDFEQGLPEGWTTIDGGEPQGYGWQQGSVKLGSTGNGHNGSDDFMLSESYDNNYGVVYPDNYLISPQVNFGSTSVFSFYASAQDAVYAAEHFGVAISTTGNTDASDFTTIQEWTMTAKGGGAPTSVTRSGNRDQGNWYQYTVDLSAYAGQTGYVAIRHFNCSDMFYLNVDDVELTSGRNDGRHYEYNQVVLTDLNGNMIYTENTTNKYCQLPVNNLVEGQTYHCKVASVYSSGLTEWAETDWVYQACDNYEGANDLYATTTEDGNLVSWTYPEISESKNLDNREMWDLMYTFYAAESGQYGVVTDGNYIYTSNWGYSSAAHNFYKYDMQGNMIEGFEIPDCGFLRGMTFDGQYVYGVANSSTVYCVDLANHTLVNTFTSAYGAMRCISYDPQRDGFWVVGNWSGDLTLINRTGAIVTIGPAPTSASDVAYYKDENNVEHVFCFDNGTNLVWDYDIATNTIVGSVFDFSTTPGFENGISGGCHVGEYNGKMAFFGDLQQSPNLIGIYELGDAVSRPISAIVYRDNQLIGFTHDNSYLDEGNTGNHQYTIRMVYGGSAICPDNNIYYSMSCPQTTSIGGSSEVTQVTDLAQGWNWWSTYIEQEGIDGLTMLEQSLGTNGHQIKSQTDFVTNYGVMWMGMLSGINNEETYMIDNTSDCQIEMTGMPVLPSDHPISISNGWNWIGYPCTNTMTVAEAFSEFTPTNGDQVKSQSDYAMYFSGMWIGQLQNITPGTGLMYKSNSIVPTPNVLVYPDGGRDTEPTITVPKALHWTNNIHAYPNNMTVMAVVELDDVELTSDNYELAAFDINGECRGSAKLMYVEPIDRYVAFLTLAGKDATELSFGLYDSEMNREYFNGEETLVYVTNATIGNPEEPYVVRFRSATGLDELDDSIQLFPNPVKGGERVSIITKADIKYPVHVEIVNALGATIAYETSTETPASFVTPKTPGVYMLRIYIDGRGTYTKKLIVR